jgi:hypothetical protein
MNTTKNAYDFPVKLSEIKTDNILIPKKLAVIREDTNEPIGIVSDKYSLIKHSEAIDMFRSALGKNKYEEKIELMKNGAQLFSTYKLFDTEVEVSKRDLVAMQIIIKNSYDGSKSLQFILGAFRLVCSNGMVIGKEFFSFSQKHISAGDLIQKDIKNTVVKMVEQFKGNLPMMQAMDKQKIVGDTTKLFDSKKIEIPNYLTKIASEKFNADGPANVWGYYNSLTYAITHELRKDSPNSRLCYLQKSWQLATALV